jgi:hypothetical protein
MTCSVLVACEPDVKRTLPLNIARFRNVRRFIANKEHRTLLLRKVSFLAGPPIVAQT